MICKPFVFKASSGRECRVFHPLKNPLCPTGVIFSGTATWRIDYYYNDRFGWRELMNYDARDRAVAKFIAWADGECA